MKYIAIANALFFFLNIFYWVFFPESHPTVHAFIAGMNLIAACDCLGRYLQARKETKRRESVGKHGLYSDGYCD